MQYGGFFFNIFTKGINAYKTMNRVELRHSTRNVSKIGRKWVTKCLALCLPSIYEIQCKATKNFFAYIEEHAKINANIIKYKNL